MKKTIFLHIGIGKTATSAIQSVLNLNRVDLIKKDVLYPTIGLKNNAHHELARLKIETFDEKITNLFNQLVEEIDNSKCNKVIISSEFFTYCRPNYILELANMLNKYDVRIIFFVRKQSELIQSTYLQWIKKNQKFDGQFIDFYENMKDAFDFNRLISPWEEAFGNSNIIARVYNKSLFDDIIDVIFEILNLDFVVKKKAPNVNESLMVEFVPLIQLLDKENCLKERELIIEEFLKLSKAFKKCSNISLLNEEILNNMYEYYLKTNISFANKYLSSHDLALINAIR